LAPVSEILITPLPVLIYSENIRDAKQTQALTLHSKSLIENQKLKSHLQHLQPTNR